MNVAERPVSKAPSLRPAGDLDVPGISALVEAAYTPWIEVMGGARPMPMTWDYGAFVEAGEAWVAEVGGEVVGLLVLKLEPDHLLLDNLAVSPAVQGQGVGKHLLSFVDDVARSHERDEVRLYTNELMASNLGYYARHGFTETGREGVPPYRRVFFSKSL